MNNNEMVVLHNGLVTVTTNHFYRAIADEAYRQLRKVGGGFGFHWSEFWQICQNTCLKRGMELRTAQAWANTITNNEHNLNQRLRAVVNEMSYRQFTCTDNDGDNF